MFLAARVGDGLVEEANVGARRRRLVRKTTDGVDSFKCTSAIWFQCVALLWAMQRLP